MTDHVMPLWAIAAMTFKLQSNEINLTCDACDGWSPDTAAHSTTSTPFLIYLCQKYFTLGTTGADSQGGTILHELTHFTYSFQENGCEPLPNDGVACQTQTITINGTGDYAYGTAAAAALAASNIHEARYNADNWEFFYENPTNLQ
ncbi:M35 family metallo-endopeptidase [Dyella mobilis]|uniref:Lysine-specific metallo-endopeptidase domain-containing protein n=1 Tax=Dyella mobilis TaxID=1849582 RepID=A0ABS2KBW8_9GAMM|nr:M35 family metallo-endopeptidase [Dyella mobilis]MBM7128681.1 hypothetical protein [Dyella mobilis]